MLSQPRDDQATQALSSNVFPHSTFNWVGIDGTQVLSHMTPVGKGQRPPAEVVVLKEFPRHIQCTSYRR